MKSKAEVLSDSAQDGNVSPHAGAASRDGAVLAKKEESNRSDDYPDVEAAPDAALLCLGVETYGRWGTHCLQLVRQLARLRALDAAPILQRAFQQGYERRWWFILSVTVQRAVAETALRDAGADLAAAPPDCELPNVMDVLDLSQ